MFLITGLGYSFVSRVSFELGRKRQTKGISGK